MKKFKIVLTIVMIFFVSLLFSRALKKNTEERILNQTSVNNAANFNLRVSNFGTLGSGSSDISYPSLEYPIGSNINYLYIGAVWIGAKKVRKDENGNSLYWLPNANSIYDVVNESDSLWTPDLELVVDTLTSVGFDGDANLYELLPAYNPFESSALNNQYDEYNLLDKVVKIVGNKNNFDDDNDGLIDEDNLGYPFNYNDPSNIFCFTNPTDEDGDGLFDEDTSYPGFETSLSYFYDYSPFGTAGQRDYGTAQAYNMHVPLGIALKQEIYDWSAQSYAKFAIIKNSIYNTSNSDTLFDVIYSYYLDPDIGPEDWENIASDDVSSYVGDGYDFAYAYDADHDDGLTPGYVGIKTFLNNNENYDCWTWSVGDGPDDSNVQFPGHHNEKYALMHGVNPNIEKYISLKDNPDLLINNPRDTRFLYTLYGDQNGFNNPSQNSINILPGDSLVYYSALLLGDSVDELKSEVALAEDFINLNFDYSLFDGLASIPYLKSLENYGNGNSIRINWETLTEPGEFRIYHKEEDAPESTWEYIVVDPNLNTYVESDLDENVSYKFKVASLFGDVYLESQPLSITPTVSINPDEMIATAEPISNYPNPFNPETIISYSLSTNDNIKLEIYNIKGQKVRTLVNKRQKSGYYQSAWDGKDDSGKKLSSGIYLYRLKTSDKLFTRKMLMLK